MVGLHAPFNCAAKRKPREDKWQRSGRRGKRSPLQQALCKGSRVGVVALVARGGWDTFPASRHHSPLGATTLSPFRRKGGGPMLCRGDTDNCQHAPSIQATFGIPNKFYSKCCHKIKIQTQTMFGWLSLKVRYKHKLKYFPIHGNPKTFMFVC